MSRQIIGFYKMTKYKLYLKVHPKLHDIYCMFFHKYYALALPNLVFCHIEMLSMNTKKAEPLDTIDKIVLLFYIHLLTIRVICC